MLDICILAVSGKDFKVLRMHYFKFVGDAGIYKRDNDRLKWFVDHYIEMRFMFR